MSKFTQKAIVSTFLQLLEEKSLDKITVKDIIETAEINRNTFYYYYDNIPDLIEKIFQDELKKFHEETIEDSAFYEEYARAAAIFLQNRRAVVHIFNSKNRETMDHYLEACVRDFVERLVRRNASEMKVTEDAISYVTTFYTNAIVGYTLHWMEEGMPDYSKDLLRSISRSFDSTVKIMLSEYMLQ